MPRALITGITGQDGSYLAEYLLAKGYEVHGIIRRASTFNTHRIDHIYIDPHESDARLLLHYGDLSDPGIITELMYTITPDEIYHLAAQSHVRVSFDMPEYTGDITGLGTTRILEAMRRSGSKSRFYQASSSEMFGSALPPQSESTIFQPQSPYAAAKLYAYWLTVNYRHAYSMYACNGILFNHESPRRGEIFVTRKITRAIAFILSGKQHKIFLGNLDSKRDWGFAPEYVEMMHLMLQQESPDDYVVGTGESYSVREFINVAFAYTGVEIEWTGAGIETKGLVKSCDSRWKNFIAIGDVVVEIDPRYFRPTEVDYLKADISKARRQLGWEPRVTFEDLVRVMIDYDLLQVGIVPPKKGIEAVKSKGFGWTNHEFSLVEALKNDIG
ncbi:MAG: GDP-mannose 4,6-dehydratase [Ignavibacteria bacterium]|nr:GDP-mannose 4,6-dehydratase [Ignavibacteria bacterium]